ncbi:MAG: NAD(P)/FAD-dependent oxidoreductase [Halobacteriaceae archaeon]
MTHVVVLGAYGSAGVATATALADAPAIDRVTLFDDGDPGGGLCILRGCMPSKEVLSAAAHKYQARHDPRLDGTPTVDLEAVVATKDDHVSDFAAHRREAVHDLATRPGVEFHHERARFVDDHTVLADGTEYTADYVVIATGSRLNVPDIPGIDDVDWMDSADVLDATAFPDSGVVMGFGYVGIELVPYLAEAAEMDLTVIEHDDRPLDAAHPSIGEEILAQYREEFDVDILTNTTEQRVESTEDGVRLTVDGATDRDAIEADQLFLFTGRRPNLEGLGLETTDLDPGPGWVEPTLRARDDGRTFVVGDAIGERMILHEAKEEGFLAAENILADHRGDTLTPYDPLNHTVMFSGASVYPYASLGLTAADARSQGYDPIVVARAASDDGVFKTKDAARGLARLVVAQDGTVLGYHGLHYHADVMAKTMQVVIECGLDVREIPDRAYHPTTPEIIDGLLDAAIDRL